MKVSLLYLCVLTLLQLQSRYVTSASEIIWLPTIETMSSLIRSCERAFSNTVRLQKRPTVVIPKLLLPLPNKPNGLDINSRIEVNKGYGSAVRASSNIVVNSDQSVSVRNNVDAGKNQAILWPKQRSINVNVGDQSIKNLNFGGLQPRTKREVNLKPILITIGANNIRNSMSYDPIQRIAPIKNVVSINNKNLQDDKGLLRSPKAKVAIYRLPSRPTRSPFNDLHKLRTVAACVKNRILQHYVINRKLNGQF